MAVAFGIILKDLAKNATAVFNNSIEQHEYDSFRESLARACLYLLTFCYAAATIIRIIIPVNKVPIKWTWSELLINYQGGFVRRGLFGEFLFQIQPVIPTVMAVTILILLAYFLFAFLVLKLLRETPLLVFLFFVFSPATFLFPVYEPSVFGRKEIFFFCAFALAIVTYRKYSDYRVKVCSFLALYTITTLIHDAAIFFAPLAASLLVLSMADHEKQFRTKVLTALFAYCFALGCFLLFSVDPDHDPSGIIQSWSPYFPNISSGAALDYLNKGLDKFLVQTGQKARNFNGFTAPFLIDFCWALLPIFLLVIHTTHFEYFKALRKEEPFLFFCTIISLIAPLLLFCFQDWGRWIYFFTVHTFIFLITLNRFGLVAYKAVAPITRDQWRIYILFFLYYALLWRMPHLR